MNGSVRRTRGDGGAALVEFALVLPVLVTLLLGLTTSGLAFNAKMDLTHATREGARYGATVPQDTSFVSGTWATNVRNVVVSRSAGDLKAATVCVALVTGSPPVAVDSNHTTAGTDSSGSPAACFDDSSGGVTGERVQVSGTKPASIQTGFATFHVLLKGKAVAQYEGSPLG